MQLEPLPYVCFLREVVQLQFSLLTIVGARWVLRNGRVSHGGISWGSVPQAIPSVVFSFSLGSFPSKDP